MPSIYIHIHTIRCVASAQYIHFVEIVGKTNEKDSDDDPYVGLYRANVVELEVLENPMIQLVKVEAVDGH